MGLGKTLTTLSLIAANPAGPDEPRSTLVVVPLSLLSVWRQEIGSHVPSLQVFTYHGSSRPSNPEIFGNYDVVLTTFSILAHEFKGNTSTLFGRWHRVILDEAHNIKVRNALQSRAAAALEAPRRWCLTGTPMQNSLDDLHSLVKFLRIEPFSDATWWNHHIKRPMKSNIHGLGLQRLQTLLQAICMRRTKDQEIGGRKVCDLPEKSQAVMRVHLSPAERKSYEQLFDKGRGVVNNYLTSGTLLQNYAHILEVLLRLRQLCDHPNLCPGDRKSVV